MKSLDAGQGHVHSIREVINNPRPRAPRARAHTTVHPRPTPKTLSGGNARCAGNWMSVGRNELCKREDPCCGNARCAGNWMSVGRNELCKRKDPCRGNARCAGNWMSVGRSELCKPKDLWVVGHMGARMQHAWRMQHMHSEHDDTSAVGGGAVGPVRPCVWGRDTAAVGRAVLAGARVRRRPVHEERSEREE